MSIEIGAVKAIVGKFWIHSANGESHLAVIGEMLHQGDRIVGDTVNAANAKLSLDLVGNTTKEIVLGANDVLMLDQTFLKDVFSMEDARVNKASLVAAWDAPSEELSITIEDNKDALALADTEMGDGETAAGATATDGQITPANFDERTGAFGNFTTTLLDNINTEGGDTLAGTDTINLNDRPVVANVTATVNEVLDGPNTITGQLVAFDADFTDTHTFFAVEGSLAVNGVALDGITFVLNTDGTYTVSGDFNHLAVGENAVVSFQYYAVDNGLPTGDVHDSLPATVTLTVTGTNDQPVVSDVTVSAAETNGIQTFSGQLVETDLDTTDTHTFQQIGTAKVVTNGGSTAVVTDLTVVVAANGKYTVDGNFDALAAGETATVTFTYTATDDSDANNATSEAKTVTLTVTGSNDQPIVSNVSIAATETNGTQTFSGQLTETDLDTTDTHTFQQTGTAAVTTSSGAVITDLAVAVAASGIYTVNGNFDALAAGETATVTFTYTATDDSGAANKVSEPKTVILTVTGTNDAPVISNTSVISGTATEAGNLDDGTAVAATVATGTMVSSDIDNGATATWTGNAAGTYGAFAITEAGVWTYTVDATAGSAADKLAEGESKTETFTAKVTDDKGATATQTVTVTITGTNDSPVATVDTGATDENTSVTIDVLENDTDIDNGHTFTLTNVSSPKGRVSIVDNKLVFDANAKDFDHLAQGTKEDVAVTYTIRDEFGATSTSTATVTVTGTNDRPVISDVNANGTGNGEVVGLDTLDLTTSGTQLNTNAGQRFIATEGSLSKVEINFMNSAVGTTKIQITDSAGVVVFTSNVLTLPGTGSNVLSASISASLTKGAVYNIHLVEANIGQYALDFSTTTGAAAADSVGVTYGGSLYDAYNMSIKLTYGSGATVILETTNPNEVTTFSGSLATATDLDVTPIPDTHKYTLVAGTAKVDNATVTIDDSNIKISPEGIYTLSGNFGALAAGEKATVTFNYVATDNSGAANAESAPVKVTITITGTNDVPTFSTGAGSDLGGVLEDAAITTLTTTGTLVVTDTDANQSAINTNVAPVASANALGSLSIGTNGAWTYTVPNASVQYLAANETKTETFTVQSVDGTTHNIVITITGTNDAATAVIDSNTVNESGLSSGTTAGDASNITIGNIFTNDSGKDIYITQVNGVNVFGTQTVTTTYGTLEINTVTGDYKYTLTGATTDVAGVDEVDSISYTIKDVNGDTSSAKLNIIINDDVPILSDLTTTIDIGAITTNLVIVLDKSGSMADTAAGTTIDRLDLAKDAITQLINSYDGLGTVNVKLITFNDNAYEFSWNTATNTIDYINGSTGPWWNSRDNIVASGGTDYDDSLRFLIDGYNNVNTTDADGWSGTNIVEPTPTATNSYLYFFSDGEPNTVDYKSQITNYEATWKQFTSNNFDEVYSIGMGSGVSKTYLDMISSKADNTILVTDESTLASRVIDTVVVSGSGNILTGSSTSSATMLGADGGSLESFSHAGTMYTIANATLDSDSNGTMDTVVFTTAHGAEAIVNFITGDYTYNVQSNDNGGVDFSDVFTIKLVDGDGDYGNPATSTVTINVNFDATSTGTTQNYSVTAVDDVVYAREDTVFISSVDLDKNDIDLDNDPLSVTAGTFMTTQAGTIVIAADGSYTYTPASNFSGTDTVEYTVTDGKTTDIGKLTINVLPVADAIPAGDASIVLGAPTQFSMDFTNITIPSVSSYTFSPGGIVLSTGNPDYVFTDSNGLTLGITQKNVNGDGRIDGTDAATFTFPVGMQSMSLVLKNAADDTVKITTDLNITNPSSISIAGVISGTLLALADKTNVTMNLILIGSTGSVTVPIEVKSGGLWSIVSSYDAVTYGTFSKATIVTLMDGELFNNGGSKDATVQFAVNTDMKNLSISQVPDGIYSANQNNGFQIDYVSVSPNYDGSISYTYPIDIYAKIQDFVGTPETFTVLKLSDFPNPTGSTISVVLSNGSYAEVSANSSGEYDLSAYTTLLNTATGTTFVDKIYLTTSTPLDTTFIPTMTIGTQDGSSVAYSIFGGTASSTLTGGDGNDYISGGAGTDTLILTAGTDIDFSNLGNVIKNIEAIDLGHGGTADNHALTNLSVQDVMDMTTDSTHTLTILGDSADSVALTPGEWTKAPDSVLENGHTLDIYHSGDSTVTLKIEHDINQL